MHAKRVLSLSRGTLGVIHSASLAVATIGRSLAQAMGLHAKHAIKQVDRLLSNHDIIVDDVLAHWAPFVVGAREEIVVALDWTEFDADDQSTLTLSMVTRHGRATPLMWKSVVKSTIKGQHTAVEIALLTRLSQIIPSGVKIIVLGDRGFGSAELYAHHNLQGLGHVLRFRGNISVTCDGVTKLARDWISPGGRARIMRNVTVTHHKVPIDAFVCIHGKDMKEPWFLAVGGPVSARCASELVKLYSRRFSIEENFRDTKDLRFGMGLSSARIKTPERRDRLLLLSAFAVALLTILGAAAEEIGYDRLLRANTVKTRTHSLFNQGVYFYGAIPNMPVERLRPLMKKFGELILSVPVFQNVYGII